MADKAIVTSLSITVEYESKEKFVISSLLNDTSGNIYNIASVDNARTNDIVCNYTLDIKSHGISIVINISKSEILYWMK